MKSLLKNKGATFGLDARIALVVLAVLSLAGGYEALNYVLGMKAREILFVSKELAKAIEIYEFDTNSSLDLYEFDSVLKARELIKSSKPGWKGPYLSMVRSHSDDINRYLVENNIGKFSILKSSDREAVNVTDSPYIKCDETKACYLWALYESKAISRNKYLIRRLDERLDSQDGFLKGKIQMYNNMLLFRIKKVDI